MIVQCKEDVEKNSYTHRQTHMLNINPAQYDVLGWVKMAYKNLIEFSWGMLSFLIFLQ